MALVFLRQRRGRCRALEWHEGDRRYLCGMARRPAHYLRWLPGWLAGSAARFAASRIAAGAGCDSGIETGEPWADGQ